MLHNPDYHPITFSQATGENKRILSEERPVARGLAYTLVWMAGDSTIRSVCRSDGFMWYYNA